MVDDPHVEMLICPSCSGFVRRDWDNCRHCGHELNDVVEVQPTTPVVPTPPAEPGAPETVADLTAPTDEESGSIGNPIDETDVGSSEVVDVEDPAPLDLTDGASDEDGGDQSKEDDPAVASPSDSVVPPVPDPPVMPAPAPAPGAGPDVEVLDESDELGRTTGAVPADGSGSAFPSKTVLAIAIVVVLALVAVVTLATVKQAAHEDPAPVTAAAPAPLELVHYTDPGKRFSLDVPSVPAVFDESIDNKQSNLVQSDTNDKVIRFKLRSTVSPDGWSKEDKVLSDALARFAATQNAKVETSVITRVNDRRQLAATLTSGQERSSYRVYVSGNILYEFSMTSYDGKPQPELFTRVADSFVEPAF